MNSSETSIGLSRIHWPVTTLGYGKRIGIWFQGCSIGCKGCCARDTWVASPSHRIELEKILAWIKQKPLSQVEGFTITGGEPFDQPGALQALLQELRALDESCARDILVYSGYPWSALRKKHSVLLQSIDALVSGPYVGHRKAVYLRGSDNQQLHLLSRLADRRYADSAPLESQLKEAQIHYDGQQLWMIGIPGDDTSNQLLERLEAAGIRAETVSWIA